MIEMLGNSSQLPHHGGRHNLTKLKAKSMEEVVIEKGVLTVFKALIRNCNSAIYEVSYALTECLSLSLFSEING